jgi:hypothetical protein
MKNLKTFKQLFEAVIVPERLPKPENRFYSFDDLKKYGEENGIDIVNYDEFYDSLDEENKETAPPNDKFRAPIFALFHPERKKPMFVLANEGFLNMPNFFEIFSNIISHEMVHKGQTDRRGGLSFTLPDPTNKKEYFSNKDEIMAFSWTFANSIYENNKRNKERVMQALAKIKNLSSLPNRLEMGHQESKMLEDISVNIKDEKILRKYKKYIYLYLEHLYENSDEIQTQIPKKNKVEIKNERPKFKPEEKIKEKPQEIANNFSSSDSTSISKKPSYNEDNLIKGMTHYLHNEKIIDHFKKSEFDDFKKYKRSEEYVSFLLKIKKTLLNKDSVFKYYDPQNWRLSEDWKKLSDNISEEKYKKIVTNIIRDLFINFN